MDIGLLRGLLYGLIVGIAEFMPVSASAHEFVLLQLFGADSHNPVLDLMVHLGLLGAVFFSDRAYLKRIRRESAIATRARARRRQAQNLRAVYDLGLVRTAAFPMVLGLALLTFTKRFHTSPVYTAAFLVLNGIVLYITDHMPQSNKSAKSMTGMDAILIGLSAAVSVLPGVSRTGMTVATATMRGGERSQTFSWAVLLSVPALIVLMVVDVVFVIVNGIGLISFASVAGYFGAAVMALVGGSLAIRLMHNLLKSSGFSPFAYYCWGLALYIFILFLIL